MSDAVISAPINTLGETIDRKAAWRQGLTAVQDHVLRQHWTERPAGWPSIDRPAASRAVREHENRSLYMRRTEVRCGRCDGHLGHMFPDGPRETTGLRHGINGIAPKFKPEDG